MHGPEESDSVIVAVKPTNKAEQSVAEPVSQGRKPRETPTSKARAGRRTGQACHRRLNAYGKQLRVFDHAGLGGRRTNRSNPSRSRWHRRLRLLVFPTRTGGVHPPAKPEASRFPCKELPHMLRVFDHAGLGGRSRYRAPHVG